MLLVQSKNREANSYRSDVLHFTKSKEQKGRLAGNLQAISAVHGG